MSTFYKTEGSQVPSSNGKRRLLLAGGVLLVTLMVLAIVTSLISGGSNSKDGTVGKNFSLYSNSWFSTNAPKDYTRTGDYVDVLFTGAQEEAEDSYSVLRYAEVDSLQTPDQLKESLAAEGVTTRTTMISERQAVIAQTAGATTTMDYYIFGEAYIWKLSFSYGEGSDLKNDVEKIVSSFDPKDSTVKALEAQVNRTSEEVVE